MKEIIFIIIFFTIAIATGIFLWPNDSNEKDKENKSALVELTEAAKVGEAATHKLLVQIENPKGNSEDIKSRYQRGDIVMAVPGDREFSLAEKSSFLILKMNLTSKQAELLMRPQEKGIKKSTARREFAVDFKKIGIGEDIQTGKEIPEVYKWEEVIIEKNNL